MSRTRAVFDNPGRSCLRAILLLWLLLGSWLALAQDGVAQEVDAAAAVPIQQVKVQVLPEFDDPRVLVVVQGRMDASSSDFPLSVAFRLPQGAQINQMASMDLETGGTEAQPYDVQPDTEHPGWMLVNYNLDNAHFFYEYYYDPLQMQVDPLPARAARVFSFTWSSPQPAENVLIEILQPAGAIVFELDPAQSSSRVDQALGLTFHQIPVGRLADGTASVQIRYEKADLVPSLSRQEAVPGQVANTALDILQAPETTGSWPILWPMILVAGAFVAAMMLWYRRRAPRRTAVALAVDSGPFCHRCGTRLRGGAAYCHSCGAQARAEIEA